jgi:hypothetical protein
MRKNPRRILSPQRLPFRHPGDWQYKVNEFGYFLQHCHLDGPALPLLNYCGL